MSSQRSQPPQEVWYEYYPFERTVVEYEEREKVEQMAVEKEVVEYQLVKRKVRRPVERTVQDYYLVETVTDFKVEMQEQKENQLVEKAVETKRVSYVPIESRNVIYPEGVPREYIDSIMKSGVHPLSQEDMLLMKARPVLKEQSMNKLPTSRTSVRPEVGGRFDFEGANQYTVIFEQRATGMILQVEEDRTYEGAAVVLKEWTESPRQRWRLRRVGQYFQIQNVHSRMVLEVGWQGRVSQAVGMGEESQLWKLSPHEEGVTVRAKGARNLVLGSSEPGTAAGNEFRGRDEQWWTVHGLKFN